jgi:hypothetical protein
MNAASEQRFPALLVHNDGSITILPTSDTWSCDPDLWYQSDPAEFVIDYNGTRFDQEATRGADGHPFEPPTWRRNRHLSAPELAELGFRHLAAEGHDPGPLRSALAVISERQIPALLVDYICFLDA